MPQRNLARWMHRNVITLTRAASLDEADALMSRHDIGRLVVVEDDKVIGIVSRGDLRAAKISVAADAREFSRVATVGDIMTPDPVTIPATATIALAAHTMLRLKVGGLPVVDADGKLCGILSQSDLCRFIIDLAQEPA